MKFLYIFLFTILLSSFTSAISLSGDALTVETFYEYGTQRTYNYEFTTNSFQQDYLIYKQKRVGHDLTPYIRVTPTEFKQMPTNSKGKFQITLDFKDETIPPGIHEAIVAVKETESSGGTVGAVASVGVRFVVVSLSPTEYIKWDLDVANVNEGEMATVTSVARNWGVPDIEDLRFEYKIYDSKNNLLKELSTGEYSVESKLAERIETTFSTEDWPPADYLVKGKAYFADQVMEKETRFRIGTKTVNINSITQEFVPEAINKVAVNLASGWNEDIEEIKGFVNIKKNGETVNSFNLLPRGLEAWEKAPMTGFFDTTGLEVGEYQADITITFDEESTRQVFDVSIVETANTKTVEQVPGQIQWTSPSTLIIVLLSLILIFNILYLFRRKK